MITKPDPHAVGCRNPQFTWPCDTQIVQACKVTVYIDFWPKTTKITKALKYSTSKNVYNLKSMSLDSVPWRNWVFQKNARSQRNLSPTRVDIYICGSESTRKKCKLSAPSVLTQTNVRKKRKQSTYSTPKENNEPAHGGMFRCLCCFIVVAHVVGVLTLKHRTKCAHKRLSKSRFLCKYVLHCKENQLQWILCGSANVETQNKMCTQTSVQVTFSMQIYSALQRESAPMNTHQSRICLRRLNSLSSFSYLRFWSLCRFDRRSAAEFGVSEICRWDSIGSALEKTTT